MKGALRFDPPKGEWVISSTPDVTMRLKRLFPRMAQEQAKELRLKETDEIASDLEWILVRFPFTLTPDDAERLRTRAKRHRDRMERMDRILSSPPAPSQFSMALQLRDYQVVGTALYLEQRALLLADAVGLGKTPTAIGSLTDHRTIPAAVVVQTHLVKQWARELKKFIPDIITHEVKQRKEYNLPPADVYILTYSKIAAWWGILATKVKSVIFDEVQELRSLKSEKYRTAKLLCSVVPFKIGLSATPIYNYGGEVWNVVSLLFPDALGTAEEFYREWCYASGTGKWIVKDPDALGHYLREMKIMIRRTRKDIGRTLPPVVKYVQDCEFDQAIYDKGTSSAEELARIMLTGDFIQRGQATREFELQVRQATGVAKAPFVAELIRMLVESGEKVLVGAWHRQVHDILAERLRDLRPVFFTGHESAAEKERSLQAFVKGETDIIVLSNRSGAGIDCLQNVCSCAVVAELDWAPAVIDQLIGRLARDGQTESVQVFIPVAPVGSDPVMSSVLALKTAQHDGIVDLGAGGSGITSADPDRLKNLARDFLRARRVPLPAESNSEPEPANA